MKKVIALFSIIGLLAAVSVSAQTKTTDTKKTETKAMDSKMTDHKMMKDHVCTAACMNGKHMYAHGEKGHVCTAECMKMEKMNKEKMGDGKMDSKKESK